MHKKIVWYVMVAVPFLIIVVVATAWLNGDYWLAKYYFQRLDKTIDGSEIIDINEKIIGMAERIVPLLEETYRNTKSSGRRRNTAALAIVNADKERAEKLFLEYVRHKDEAIVADAIRHLGYSRSKSAYQEIAIHLKSTNPEIRKAVASYLGRVSDMPDAKLLLQGISKTDPSFEVRDYAKYCQWRYKQKENTEKSGR